MIDVIVYSITYSNNRDNILLLNGREGIIPSSQFCKTIIKTVLRGTTILVPSLQWSY